MSTAEKLTDQVPKLDALIPDNAPFQNLSGEEAEDLLVALARYDEDEWNHPLDYRSARQNLYLIVVRAVEGGASLYQVLAHLKAIQDGMKGTCDTYKAFYDEWRAKLSRVEEYEKAIKKALIRLVEKLGAPTKTGGMLLNSDSGRFSVSYQERPIRENDLEKLEEVQPACVRVKKELDRSTASKLLRDGELSEDAYSLIEWDTSATLRVSAGKAKR